MLTRTKAALRRLETELYHHPTGFELLRGLKIARAPREYLRRQRLARTSGMPSDLALPEEGYRRLDASELPGFEAMMAGAQARIDACTPNLDAWQEIHGARHAINFDLLSDELLHEHREYVDFCLSDTLLGAVFASLGTVPVLRRLGIAYSPGGAERPFGSQLFHRDGEDRSQVKLYVLLRDVGEHQGPFRFFSAQESQRLRDLAPSVRPELDHSRVHGPYDDGWVEEAAREPLHELTGPAGTALLIDTSRCMHYGSRVEEGFQRFSLHVVFRPYHSVHETPFNVFDPERLGVDEVRTAVLRGRERMPMGWYYPDPSLGPKARGGGMG